MAIRHGRMSNARVCPAAAGGSSDTPAYRPAEAPPTTCRARASGTSAGTLSSTPSSSGVDPSQLQPAGQQPGDFDRRTAPGEQSLPRHEDRDHGSSVLAVDAEVPVGGEDRALGMRFRHADQASIGQGHRHLRILRHELPDAGGVIGQVEAQFSPCRGKSPPRPPRGRAQARAKGSTSPKGRPRTSARAA